MDSLIIIKHSDGTIEFTNVSNAKFHLFFFVNFFFKGNDY